MSIAYEFNEVRKDIPDGNLQFNGKIIIALKLSYRYKRANK
jgi:hypothetical protein